QKLEITNQENEVQKAQKIQIIVDEPEEMDIQDTASATPTSQKVEIVSEQTSISARDDTEPNILGITISSPISQTDQQNDEPVNDNDKSNKIKTRKQTGIFNYDIMKIDSSNFILKAPDISIQSPETLMSDLGSDFIDFSDDDDEPRIITRFFGKSNSADDLIKTSSDATYSVLHIYTGQNIPTNFKYKICLLSQKTTTAALIKQAIHRFKLNDENW
ncbi:17110_t:CDS:2, partial [Gigaspora rosea]